MPRRRIISTKTTKVRFFRPVPTYRVNHGCKQITVWFSFVDNYAVKGQAEKDGTQLMKDLEPISKFEGYEEDIVFPVFVARKKPKRRQGHQCACLGSTPNSIAPQANSGVLYCSS
jgi:hypothetical protein